MDPFGISGVMSYPRLRRKVARLSGLYHHFPSLLAGIASRVARLSPFCFDVKLPGFTHQA
jgi:hypothetical protein